MNEILDRKFFFMPDVQIAYINDFCFVRFQTNGKMQYLDFDDQPTLSVDFVLKEDGTLISDYFKFGAKLHWDSEKQILKIIQGLAPESTNTNKAEFELRFKELPPTQIDCSLEEIEKLQNESFWEIEFRGRKTEIEISPFYKKSQKEIERIMKNRVLAYQLPDEHHLLWNKQTLFLIVEKFGQIKGRIPIVNFSKEIFTVEYALSNLPAALPLKMIHQRVFK